MFNRQLCASHLEAHITGHGFSLREAARRSGVSASTLSRLLRGESPDMETFAILCGWMRLPPGVFFEVPDLPALVQGVTPLAQAIYALRSDELLAGEVRERLVDLLKATYHCLVEHGEEGKKT